MMFLHVFVSLLDQGLHASALPHCKGTREADCVQENREADENDEQRNEDVEKDVAAFAMRTS